MASRRLRERSELVASVAARTIPVEHSHERETNHATEHDALRQTLADANGDWVEAWRVATDEDADTPEPLRGELYGLSSTIRLSLTTGNSRRPGRWDRQRLVAELVAELSLKPLDAATQCPDLVADRGHATAEFDGAVAELRVGNDRTPTDAVVLASG